MNKLNKISALALSLLTLACSKPDVEIAEQNNAYSLDPKVTNVDMPEKVAFDPSNLLRANTTLDYKVEALKDLTAPNSPLELESNKLLLPIQLKKALAQPVKILLTENSELLKEYAGDKTNRKAFPNGALATKEFTIPAGVTTYTAELNLLDLNSLSAGSGYITAYGLSVEAGRDDLIISNSSKALFVSFDIVEHSSPNMPRITMQISPSNDRNTFTAYVSYKFINPSSVNIDVELDKEAPEEIKVRFEQDDTIPQDARANQTERSYRPLPKDVLPLSQEYTIPAGTKKHRLSLSLNRDASLSQGGYITTIRLVPVSHAGKVKAISNNYRLIVVNAR